MKFHVRDIMQKSKPTVNLRTRSDSELWARSSSNVVVRARFYM